MTQPTELQTILEELKKYNHFKYPLSPLDEGYKQTFAKRVEKYIEKINQLPHGELALILKKEVKTIQNSKKTIDRVISHYLSGSNAKAYSTFHTHMKKMRSHLENLAYIYEAEEKFYRVRVSDKEITDKKEIFHIPYDKRSLVKTQRYSIAGVPSIYLGNSIYVCWKELDKPDLNKMYISQFVTERRLKILDFAITFETLNIIPTIHDQRPTQYSYEKIKAFFILYPLVLACSFTKQYENATFNIEYIIPNMILQWLSTEKDHFDGIRYFSTKMKHERYNSIGINVVMPTKEKKDSLEKDEFCPKLKSTFKYTAPVSWALINTFPDAGQTFGNGAKNIEDDQKILQNIDELVLQHYKITRFYNVEKNLTHYFLPLLMDDKTRPKNFDFMNPWE